eukprot:5853017-Amphidinium_carterae.2
MQIGPMRVRCGRCLVTCTTANSRRALRGRRNGGRYQSRGGGKGVITRSPPPVSSPCTPTPTAG